MCWKNNQDFIIAIYLFRNDTIIATYGYSVLFLPSILTIICYLDNKIESEFNSKSTGKLKSNEKYKNLGYWNLSFFSSLKCQEVTWPFEWTTMDQSRVLSGQQWTNHGCCCIYQKAMQFKGIFENTLKIKKLSRLLHSIANNHIHIMNLCDSAWDIQDLWSCHIVNIQNR